MILDCFCRKFLKYCFLSLFLGLYSNLFTSIIFPYSCGKDNRTLLWDLFTLQAIYELPATETPTTDPTGAAAEASSSAPGMYGGSLSSSQQKRYDVKWSPIQRGVVSTCSFDRKVQTHSVIGAATVSVCVCVCLCVCFDSIRILQYFFSFYFSMLNHTYIALYLYLIKI